MECNVNSTNQEWYLYDAKGQRVLRRSTNSNTTLTVYAFGREEHVYSSSGSKQGTHGTAIGFTGQYADSASGLDYYNARYYDLVAGVFISADTMQGNVQGLDPYSYVGGSPETLTDPSGQATLVHVGRNSYVIAGTDPRIHCLLQSGHGSAFQVDVSREAFPCFISQAFLLTGTSELLAFN